MTVATRGSLSEFDQFLELSRQIGTDILKTQGAGGNTSLKRDGTMWVKASGTWLAHAGERDIMVPVTVAPLVDALRRKDERAEKATDFVVGPLNSSGLRPSIETSFHAALPNAVIAHYHCVNTIALSVLTNREQVLAERLGATGLSWTTVPYRRPGTPLAREVDAASASRPDVLILFNHGIIIVGETVDEVAAKIETVSASLAMPPREAGVPSFSMLETLSSQTGYSPASDMESHQLALSRENIRLAAGGSMYPDHVIFLGTEIGVLPDGMPLGEFLTSVPAGMAPKLVIVPGHGVLLSDQLTQGGKVMARCLAEVVARIPDHAQVIYLTDDDEHDLTNWEAEQYRQALDREAIRK